MNQIKLGESNMMYKVCSGCENYQYCCEYERLCMGKQEATKRRNLIKYDFKAIPGVEKYIKVFIARMNCYVVSFEYKGATYQYSCVEEGKPLTFEVLKKLGSKEIYLGVGDLKECYEKYGIFKEDLKAFKELYGAIEKSEVRRQK